MNNYKDLIKSFNEKDYTKSVNLHLHSTYSDGEANVYDIINLAHEKGYKNIAISDHNTVNAYLENDLLSDRMNIPAIEFDCWCGTIFLHILGYGIDVHNQELQSICAKNKRETEVDLVRLLSIRSAKKVIETIHKAGGLAVLAHPACCFTFRLDALVKKLISYGLDGLEVYYPYERHRKIVKFHRASTIGKLADKYDLIKTGGTDMHNLSL